MQYLHCCFAVIPTRVSRLFQGHRVEARINPLTFVMRKIGSSIVQNSRVGSRQSAASHALARFKFPNQCGSMKLKSVILWKIPNENDSNSETGPFELFYERTQHRSRLRKSFHYCWIEIHCVFVPIGCPPMQLL